MSEAECVLDRKQRERNLIVLHAAYPEAYVKLLRVTVDVADDHGCWLG